MSSQTVDQFDVVVIGSGPAGQNAALTAANTGARVLIIEREQNVGGACVQYGTIPSKTLRETAVTLSAFKRRSGGVYDIAARPSLQLDSLMTRLHQVVNAHQQTTARYLSDAGIVRMHGHARFVSPTEISITKNCGKQSLVCGRFTIIATGSRPRDPDEIDIDHENILDSDSILSMAYLPQSLTVFGGGVIASEYASTFASLSVRVTVIDRYPKPLGFLDAELADNFLNHFEENGGVFLGCRKIKSVVWDGVSCVETTLEDGDVIRSDKALVAQGRVANTDGLNLEGAGIVVTDRGLIEVDENFCTNVPLIYAVGDTIGPPALASTSMEQGRCAAQHAMGRAGQLTADVTPMGIYTIPEIASVGLDENQARTAGHNILVGRAKFSDLARGQIMASPNGLLKLVAEETGHKILGVQIIGDGATELIHLGQMALVGQLTISDMAATVFNFPTLAEAYRLAVHDILRQRQEAACHTAVESTCLA